MQYGISFLHTWPLDPILRDKEMSGGVTECMAFLVLPKLLTDSYIQYTNWRYELITFQQVLTGMCSIYARKRIPPKFELFEYKHCNGTKCTDRSGNMLISGTCFVLPK